MCVTFLQAFQRLFECSHAQAASRVSKFKLGRDTHRRTLACSWAEYGSLERSCSVSIFGTFSEQSIAVVLRLAYTARSLVALGVQAWPLVPSSFANLAFEEAEKQVPSGKARSFSVAQLCIEHSQGLAIGSCLPRHDAKSRQMSRFSRLERTPQGMCMHQELHGFGLSCAQADAFLAAVSTPLALEANWAKGAAVSTLVRNFGFRCRSAP